MNLSLRGVAIAVLGFLGLLLAVSATRGAFLGYRASRWPQVNGVVQSSYAETIGSGKSRHRQAFITYKYEVAGHLYSSDRLSYATTQIVDFEPQADEMVAAYRPGALVTVHYSPSDPSEAVLQPGGYLADALVATLSVFFIGGALRIYKTAVPTGPAA